MLCVFEYQNAYWEFQNIPKMCIDLNSVLKSKPVRSKEQGSHTTTIMHLVLTVEKIKEM